jgi:GDP-mannose 6-dehydrogenase
VPRPDTDAGHSSTGRAPLTAVSVCGLGYVGAVTAACLAEQGFQVLGVDVSPHKVASINAGIAPIIEAEIAVIVSRNVAAGRLRATDNLREAILGTQATLICVGTPSQSNGDLDLQYVRRVAQEIGEVLAHKEAYHTVILRSTVLPGTTEEVVLPILEQASGKHCGVGFGLCFNPEFLREGTSVRDFYSPPFTLVGVRSPQDADAVRALYGWLDAEFLIESIPAAEMVKYINNSYHAVKVAFANEVGRLCAALDIDSHRVMHVFCKDTKQNLSSYYLKPGYAFGGSCLPKDLRAILYKAKSRDVAMQLFQATLNSNRTQTELAAEMVQQAGHKQIGLLGLSFKAGTDDLRESPLVTLVETLLGRGYQIRIFDANVALSRLVGSNKAYIEQQLPHIGQLMSESIEEVITKSSTIIIGNHDPQFAEILPRIPGDKVVIDLVRIVQDLRDTPAGYRGIGW